MFDDALVINKANPVPSEIVPSMSWLSKKIIPANNVTADYVMPTISKRFVKKRFDETENRITQKLLLLLSSTANYHSLNIALKLAQNNRSNFVYTDVYLNKISL
jgi:hypothetical protein